MFYKKNNNYKLRNNIIVNTSTANGGGFTVAHRRADTNNENFSTASNNNLLYAGVPSASNLIMYNSTASYSTLASYQTLMGTRESASVSELRTWQSTAGSSADFLKYSTTVASLADGTGANIPSYTDDFIGTARNATTPDMGAWELTIVPLLTIADNTLISAGNINQGSTSNILQSFTIREGNRTNATLNTIMIPLVGTYTTSDIQASGLKLWRTAGATFTSPTLLSSVNSTSSGSGETATFSSLAQSITKNTIGYFWVTVDIDPSAVALRTINANALAPANAVFALGTPTGTASAGGTQTILAAIPTIALANSGAPALDPLQNTTNVVLYRVDLTVGTTTAILNTAQFTTAGTYIASDVNNFKIWYHNNTDFMVGTPVLIATTSTGLGAGLQSFTGLTRNYPISTNYLFLTTDLVCTSTISNTILVNAIANTDFTFASGTPIGTGYTGSGTITINLAAPNNMTGLGTAPTLSTVALSWTAPTGCYNEVMVVASPAANTGGIPTGNGSAYTANLAYTSGTGFGNGFVAYKGTISPQTITGLTSGVTYFFKIFTRNGTNWSSGIETSVATTSYCSASSLGVPTINRVQLNTLDNTTSGFGYQLYPASGFTTTTLGQGVSYNITLTMSSSAITSVWIDYNQNGIFDTTEWVQPFTTGMSGSVPITVPMGASLGQTRIRVRSRATGFANGSTDPCTSFPTGETEDYVVTIAPPPTFTIADNGVQITAGNIIQGTTNNILQSFTITEGGNSGGFLSQLAVSLAGNYVASTDIASNGLKLWGNTTNTFATATALSTKTGASVGAGETITFNGMNFGITQSTTVFFWITTDLQGAATLGNTTNANTYTSSNFTFTAGTKSGSVSAAGTQTIVAPPIFYLRAGGTITTMSDWGTATDGLSGTVPTSLTQSGAIWNIRNNATITNPAAWTLGSGSKIIVGDGSTTTNFILPSGANIIGTIDVTNAGTLTLQNTTNPTLGVLASGSTVDYNGAGAQTIAVANYSNLTISGARGGNNVTLASGTIGVSNNFTAMATGVGTYVNTGNTVNFSGAGMQTIPAISYLNITNTGNGNRTLAPSGNISIANFFTPGSGAYTVTGSTVIYNSTSLTSYSLSTFTYNNLVIIAGTDPDYLITSGNTVTVLGNFQVNSGFFAVSNALSGTSTLNITGDCNVAGGFFEISFYSGLGMLNIGGNLNISGSGAMYILDDATSPSTTVTVNGNVSISGTGSVNLEGTSSGSGVAMLVCVGNFNVTSTSASAVDFGTGTVTNNELRIGGNFNKSGAGTFTTTSTTFIPNGFVFNKVGIQTFFYTGSNSNKTLFSVNSGSTVQMLTGLTLGNSGTVICSFTVNSGGTLDLGTQVITAGDAIDPLFTLASGGTIKTAQPLGLTANFSGFGASRLVLNSGANYEFNASVAQVTSAFVTTPTANTVNNLTINNGTNTSSTGVTLSSNLTVNGVLNPTAGKLTTGSNVLTSQAGSAAVSPSLGKATSYVVGNISISSNADGQTLLFPTGNGTWWGPATLVTNGGTGSTTFNVRYNNISHPFNSQPLPTTPEVIKTALNAY
ncbi:MAG: hypothetical protein EAZ44_06605 [Cytophagia bacterium]|nr:MAG: hypothetical protein EAZ44_06605 [Cytophagia bacterium]TAG42241.1 MAG: hypothetical protein EAZ31_06485 [Cytophagia bacterium]